MLIEKVLSVLAGLERSGVVAAWAIGGGMASVAYLEPFLTYDLDVFVILPSQSDGLVSLAPLYQHLEAEGYKPDREHVLIADVPVQFIPAYDALSEEAVRNAQETPYKGLKMKVFRLEHLAAIMLKTGRPKDIARIASVLELARMDERYLEEILRRHNLTERWEALRRTLRDKQ
jgi:hypothetical protein